MTETTEQKSERIMSLLLEVCARLRDYQPVEQNEIARRYQITTTELERITDYFERFVIKRHYWPNKDVQVGDLWLICFDKNHPFSTYAKIRVIAFTIDQFVPRPVGQYFQYPGMEGKATDIGWPCEFLKLLERNGIEIAKDPSHNWEMWENDPELKEYLEVEKKYQKEKSVLVQDE